MVYFYDVVMNGDNPATAQSNEIGHNRSASGKHTTQSILGIITWVNLEDRTLVVQSFAELKYR